MHISDAELELIMRARQQQQAIQVGGGGSVAPGAFDAFGLNNSNSVQNTGRTALVPEGINHGLVTNRGESIGGVASESILKLNTVKGKSPVVDRQTTNNKPVSPIDRLKCIELTMGLEDDSGTLIIRDLEIYKLEDVLELAYFTAWDLLRLKEMGELWITKEYLALVYLLVQKYGVSELDTWKAMSSVYPPNVAPNSKGIMSISIDKVRKQYGFKEVN